MSMYVGQCVPMYMSMSMCMYMYMSVYMYMYMCKFMHIHTDIYTGSVPPRYNGPVFHPRSTRQLGTDSVRISA